MPRKGPAPKREITPDTKFHSILVEQYIRKVMLDGKKSKAEKVVYGALDILHEKTGNDPLTVLTQYQIILQIFNRERSQTTISLYFFVPHAIGFKGRGGFHRRHSQQLHHVVLKHIPQNSRLFVVPGAMLNTEVLDGRNTDMVDISPVPYGFEDCIGKTKH